MGTSSDERPLNWFDLIDEKWLSALIGRLCGRTFKWFSNAR